MPAELFQFSRQHISKNCRCQTCWYIQYGREHLAFLTLEVRAGNAPAIALYEKLGFREVGRRKNYYRAEHEDALLMTVEFDRHG